MANHLERFRSFTQGCFSSLLVLVGEVGFIYIYIYIRFGMLRETKPAFSIMNDMNGCFV